MEVIYARNVSHALRLGCEQLEKVGERQDSRAGEVLVAPTPVMTVTTIPTERVLLEARRDANPFFHLFESLWMLHGRDDATWLDRFVSDFSSRFAEEGGHQWGAYGHRWRWSWDIDQLDVTVDRLRRDPLDRRVVISMWDPTYDLWEPAETRSAGGHTLGGGTREPRDVPCNTHIYPRVRTEKGYLQGVSHSVAGLEGETVDATTMGGAPHTSRVLDITICCRSNDVIWGAHGANAVHFSVLQEYLAGRIGASVGRMYQLSNNYHGYTEVFKKRRSNQSDSRYMTGDVHPLPMGEDWHHWDADLDEFMSWTEEQHCADVTLVTKNSWFHTVAQPMWLCHQSWKGGDRSMAGFYAEAIQAPDWRVAAQEWMERRS